MSLITLNNSVTDNLLACRTCLATERKLYSIHEYNISQAYKFLIGSEASPYDGLPQHVCNYCGLLLLKFNMFRRNSQQAQQYLEDTKTIQPNLFNHHPITLTRTETEVTDSTTPDHTDLKPEYNYDSDDIFTPDFEYTPQSPQCIQNIDTKVYTEILKIETQETNTELVKTNKKITKQLSKHRDFERDENLRDFERDFNVSVISLSRDQQMRDVLERKLSSNYLHSPYRCELCFKGVMDEESLKKHVLYQHDPSRGSIICEFCSFRYKDKRGLNQHLKKSHRLKFACKQCSYVSRTTFNAKEHFKMHTGHTHECRHCGKSYEKLSSHLTHLRIHHPSHFIWCDICGEAFIGQFGLNAHKKRAHRHLNLPSICIPCGARFASDTALTRHTAYHNCSLSPCVHCGEGFDTSLNLRDHLVEKHKSLKVYECEKCEKTFTRPSLHSAHYKRAHVDAKDKGKQQRPWVCEVCGKTLPNRCVLLYHQRNHTGERPYQCTQCNKSFTMKRLLQSHLRVHTSDRPYACKLCPKAFKGLSALRAHEHIHTGDQRKVTRNRRI